MSETENRESAAKRGYGRRWQKYRERYLREHPLCVMHQQQGHTVAADVVDHIVPHKGDPRLFWDASNLWCVCGDCHRTVCQRIEARHAGCPDLIREAKAQAASGRA